MPGNHTTKSRALAWVVAVYVVAFAVALDVAADPIWMRTAIEPIAITVLFAAYSIPAMEKRLRKSRPDWEIYAKYETA